MAVAPEGKSSKQYALRAIVRYTAQQWGAAQARDCAGLIDAAATDLATGRGLFKDWVLYCRACA